MGVSENPKIGGPLLGGPFKGTLFYSGNSTEYPYFGKCPYVLVMQDSGRGEGF